MPDPTTPPVEAPESDRTEAPTVGGNNVDELLSEGAAEAAQPIQIAPEAEGGDEPSELPEGAEGDEPAAPEDTQEPEDADKAEKPDGDADESDKDDDADADEDDAPTGPPEGDVRHFAEMLLADPRRMSEVPLKQQAAVLSEAFRDIATRAVQITAARGRDESALREMVRVKDALRASDAQAFLEWQDENPEENARYAEGRRWIATQDTTTPAPLPQAAQPSAQQAPAVDTAAIQARVQANLIPRLSALGDVQKAAVTARATAGEFQRTEQGYSAFAAAITAAEGEDARAPGPGATKAAKRTEASRARKKTARPDVGGDGAAPKNPGSIADMNDASALLSEGAEEASRAGGRRAVAAR